MLLLALGGALEPLDGFAATLVLPEGWMVLDGALSSLDSEFSDVLLSPEDVL